jgi:DNA-directed RNA polymerase specialized sigma24 family protein
MLKYQQDLSYKEISEIMDIPVNTVGSLILRGKKELREKLNLNQREALK